MTERAVAALREYLQTNGSGDWRIFHCDNLDLHDIEQHLAALGEAAAWELPPPAAPGGEPLVTMTHGDGWAKLWGAGFLHLAGRDVVVARWHWLEQDGSTYRSMWLCAAPSPDHYLRLRQEVLALRHQGGERVWQVVRGDACYDGNPLPRAAGSGDDLVLPPALRQRVEAEVVGFFDPRVAALYASMNVPYRRGVLLHGPPGNGKTSLIRLIGARLPEMPCMLLRPASDFTTDDLADVVNRWRDQAPAVLVIEDLDWLLEKVNVSTFLNLLDGVESAAGSRGGLLVVATTNHPDKLDPAVNNRPGRFDVVLEVAGPDAALRREFLSRRLAGFAADVVAKLVDVTNGLSFAHLQEVLRLAGLTAIHDNRDARSPDDLLKAAEAVRSDHDQAARGFPIKLEMPFGLRHLASKK